MEGYTCESTPSPDTYLCHKDPYKVQLWLGYVKDISRTLERCGQ